MKTPPPWLVIGSMLTMATGLASAWAGGATSDQTAHALLGALSLFCVLGIVFLWIALGAMDDSLWAYWGGATATVFTLIAAAVLYFSGFSWAALLIALVAAPIAGGAVTLKIAVFNRTGRGTAP